MHPIDLQNVNRRDSAKSKISKMWHAKKKVFNFVACKKKKKKKKKDFSLVA
jgi:hypothetical protein